MSDVEVWQLQKDYHCVIFKMEEWTGLRGRQKMTMEVGTGNVNSACLFQKWPIDQARNLWGSKIEEGYERVQ